MTKASAKATSKVWKGIVKKTARGATLELPAAWRGKRVAAVPEEHLLLLVLNRKRRAAGRPPAQVAGRPGVYAGYFENARGQQFLAVADARTGAVRLWRGDAGWAKAEHIARLGAGPTTIYVGPAAGLGPDEREWLDGFLGSLVAWRR